MYQYIYLPIKSMDKLISGSDTHKMLSLLLENYRMMLKSMHQNTNERERIKKMITELEHSLINTDVYIENFRQ